MSLLLLLLIIRRLCMIGLLLSLHRIVLLRLIIFRMLPYSSS